MTSRRFAWMIAVMPGLLRLVRCGAPPRGGWQTGQTTTKWGVVSPATSSTSQHTDVHRWSVLEANERDGEEEEQANIRPPTSSQRFDASDVSLLQTLVSNVRPRLIRGQYVVISILSDRLFSSGCLVVSDEGATATFYPLSSSKSGKSLPLAHALALLSDLMILSDNNCNAAFENLGLIAGWKQRKSVLGRGGNAIVLGVQDPEQFVLQHENWDPQVLERFDLMSNGDWNIQDYVDDIIEHEGTSHILEDGGLFPDLLEETYRSMGGLGALDLNDPVTWGNSLTQQIQADTNHAAPRPRDNIPDSQSPKGMGGIEVPEVANSSNLVDKESPRIDMREPASSGNNPGVGLASQETMDPIGESPSDSTNNEERTNAPLVKAGNIPARDLPPGTSTNESAIMLGSDPIVSVSPDSQHPRKPNTSTASMAPHTDESIADSTGELKNDQALIWSMMEDLRKMQEDNVLDTGSMPLDFGLQAEAILEGVTAENDNETRESVMIHLKDRYEDHLEQLRDYFGKMFETLLDRGPSNDKSALKERIVRAFRSAAQEAVPVSARPGGKFSGEIDMSYVSALAGLSSDLESLAENREDIAVDVLEADEAAPQRRQLPPWAKKLASRVIMLGVNYIQGRLALHAIRQAALERERDMPKIPLF